VRSYLQSFSDLEVVTSEKKWISSPGMRSLHPERSFGPKEMRPIKLDGGKRLM
jgi:hypothetical protein